MLNTKRILIETESHETLVVRIGGASRMTGFCEECSADRELLTLDDAVVRSQIAALEIMRLIQTGQIHFLQTANGHLLVCRESLHGRMSAHAIEGTEICEPKE